MKLLIVAGGGGHFAAALAVIESLPKDISVMVVGRKYTFEAEKTESLESQTAKKLGLNFVSITTGRLQRRVTRHTLFSLAKVPVGYFQALHLLRSFRPDLVLSFGGYVSVPVGFAAKTLGIPIVVHEQILGAGLANKVVAKFARKVCVSWKESAKFFPHEKVIVTGNPIRKFSISNFQFSITKEKLPIIYVTGGSSGAHAINVLIEECLEQLLEKYIVIHQTGNAKAFNDFDRLEEKKKSLPEKLQKRYSVTKFVAPQEVWSILEKADLVVSRSGINTVSELLFFGKPCLLIPLPHGQHNEQMTNAIFIKEKGIAEIAEQESLTGEKLLHLINDMIKNSDDYTKNSKTAKDAITLDAADKIISIVEHVNNETKIAKS